MSSLASKVSEKFAVTLVVEVLPKDMLGANGEHKFLPGLLRFVVQSYFTKGEQSLEAQLAEEGLIFFSWDSFFISPSAWMWTHHLLETGLIAKSLQGQ